MEDNIFVTTNDLSAYDFFTNESATEEAPIATSLGEVPFNMVEDSIVSSHTLDILLKGKGKGEIKELTNSQILLLQWHLLDKITEEYGGDSEEFAAACGCSTLEDMVDFINVLRL